MLDGGPLPQVPASGQGGAGEILALYPLFAELSTRFDAGGEGARVADQRLARRRRAGRRFGAGGAAARRAGAPRSSRSRSRPSARRWNTTTRRWRRCGATRTRRRRCRGCAPVSPAPAAGGATTRRPSATASCRACWAMPTARWRRPRTRRRSRCRGVRQPGLCAAGRGAIPTAAASARAATTTPWRRRRSTASPRSGPTSACCATGTSPSCWSGASRSCRTCCWSTASPATPTVTAMSATSPWR